MKLDDLPRYIESPQGAMWRLPENWSSAGFEDVYVKLDDVKKLLDSREIYLH